jgi:hypothetical protein
MVSTRASRFQSPDNTKSNKKQTIKHNSKNLKHNYKNTPTKTSRITDHLVKRSKKYRSYSNRTDPIFIGTSNHPNTKATKSTTEDTTKNIATTSNERTTNRSSLAKNKESRSSEDINRKNKVVTKVPAVKDTERKDTEITISSTSNEEYHKVKNTEENPEYHLKHINATKSPNMQPADRSPNIKTIEKSNQVMEDKITDDEDNNGIKDSKDTKDGKLTKNKDKSTESRKTAGLQIETGTMNPDNKERKDTSEGAKNLNLTAHTTNNEMHKEQDQSPRKTNEEQQTTISDEEESTSEAKNTEIKKADSPIYDDLILDSVENDIEKEIEEAEYNSFLQEHCPDGDSITSKKTVRNHNRNKSKDDNSQESYTSDSEYESEDDENTVDSSKSTQYKKKLSDKEIPPKNIRYQIGITIPPMDIQNIQKEFEGNKKQVPTTEDTFSKIRHHIKQLVNEMKNLDRKAKIISWKDDKTYNVLEGGPDELPKTASGLAQFFHGMRLKREHGRQYIRFRLHASRNPNRLEGQLAQWASMAGHAFYRCVIQAEHSTAIGWLLYSSQFTNTYHLSQHLQRETGFEWGFKLGSITKSDETNEGKPVQWKDRQKALIVHVPTQKSEVAITKISSILKAKSVVDDNTPLFIQRYLFVQQEHTMVDVNSRLKYKHILCRQKAHSDSIKSKFIISINVDMDKQLNTKEGGTLSLREMILGIKTRQEGDLWDPVPLFHSIDFCPDSSKVWIGTSMGPGGPGHLITYYNIVEAEALQMIRGLGIFLGKIYGYENVLECFHKDHWQSLEGWSFSRKKWKFITPESRQMNDNLKLDPNKMMVRIAQKQIRIIKKPSASEKKETPKDGKSKLQSLMNPKKGTDNGIQQKGSLDNDDETISSELNKAFRANELKLIRKNADPDLDSIGNDSTDEAPQLNNIILNDISSTTSSITTTTNDTDQPSVPYQFSTPQDDTASSISTVSSLDSITSSIHSITKDKLESLFEDGMTQQERRERADQYTFQQIRKVMIEKNKLYDTLFPDDGEYKEEPEIETEEPSQVHIQDDQHQADQTNGTTSKAEMKQQSNQQTTSKNTFSDRFTHNVADLSDQPDDDPQVTDLDNTKWTKKRNLQQETVSEVSADETR